MSPPSPLRKGPTTYTVVCLEKGCEWTYHATDKSKHGVRRATAQAHRHAQKGHEVVVIRKQRYKG